MTETREAEEATLHKSFSVLDTPFAVAYRRVKRKPAKRYAEIRKDAPPSYASDTTLSLSSISSIGDILILETLITESSINMEAQHLQQFLSQCYPWIFL